MRWIQAGVLYFALVFAAVLAELPVILLIAWHACRRLTARQKVPAPLPRAFMGALAFALLIGAEILLGAALGRPPAAQAGGLATPAGLAGLAGQVVFGLMPIGQACRSGPGRSGPRS